MKNAVSTSAESDHAQFSLKELFEYVTICSILAALSGIFGIWASLFLMLMTLAIWLKAGRIAMGMLLAVLLVANAPRSPLNHSLEYGQSILAAMVALAIAFWYGLRRSWLQQLRAANLEEKPFTPSDDTSVGPTFVNVDRWRP